VFTVWGRENGAVSGRYQNISILEQCWSVYSNVIARGGEVQFDKNAMMDVKFGARTPPKGSKFRAVVAAAGQ
jgi:hypothetical protein